MTTEIMQGPTAEEEAAFRVDDEPQEEAVASEPEPEKEPEAEPEVKVEEPAKEEPVKPKEQEILDNLKAALRENREETKALKRQLDTVGELRRQLEEMRAVKAKETEKPIPAYEEDPLGYTKATLEKIERENKMYAEKQNQLEAVTDQQRIASYVTTVESDFRKTAPDYDAAFTHLINVQKQQMKLMGVPDEHLDSMLAQQAANFTQQAVQTGKNPAQLVYEYAKLYGYKATPAVTAKPQVDQTVERLEAVQKGLDKAAKTLSKGGKTETPASVEQLLTAKGAEFDKLWNELFES